MKKKWGGIKSMPRVANRRIDLIHKIEEVLLDSPTLTLEQIADKADIAIITVYRYFETREGLIRSICEYIYDDLENMKTNVYKYRGEYIASVRHLVKEYLPYMKHVKFLFNLNNFIDERKSMEDIFKKVSLLRKEFYQHVFRLVKKGQREGYVKRNLRTDWVAFVYTSILFSARDYANIFKDQEVVEGLLVQAIVEGFQR